MVLFLFSIVIGVLDSTLDDWGLPMTFPDRANGVARRGDHLNMDIDSKGNRHFKQNEHRDNMRRSNSFLALEVLGMLTESRKAKVLLRLVHLNMYAPPFLILFSFNSSPTVNLLYICLFISQFGQGIFLKHSRNKAIVDTEYFS